MHARILSTLAPTLTLALAALLTMPYAAAQPAAAAAGNCDPRQDPAACQRESGAARAAAREGQLTSGSAASRQANALARCKALPTAQQADCEARVRGGGDGTTTSSGSVMGGGVVRETVTTVPVPATK